MSFLTKEFLGGLFLCSIAGLLIGKAIVILCFLPYRNRFMRWYMTHFNPHYKAAKSIYDELIQKHAECKTSAVNVVDEYYRFLEWLQNNERLSLKEKPRPQLTVEDILEEKIKGYQMFVYFEGKGKNWHKVWVYFDLEEEIHLQFIELFYHEERGSDSFHFKLERKSFPADSDPWGKRHVVPGPQPLSACV